MLLCGKCLSPFRGLFCGYCIEVPLVVKPPLVGKKMMMIRCMNSDFVKHNMPYVKSSSVNERHVVIVFYNLYKRLLGNRHDSNNGRGERLDLNQVCAVYTV